MTLDWTGLEKFRTAYTRANGEIPGDLDWIGKFHNRLHFRLWIGLEKFRAAYTRAAVIVSYRKFLHTSQRASHSTAFTASTIVAHTGRRATASICADDLPLTPIRRGYAH